LDCFLHPVFEIREEEDEKEEREVKENNKK
jgi:hypothetical protein